MSYSTAPFLFSISTYQFVMLFPFGLFSIPLSQPPLLFASLIMSRQLKPRFLSHGSIYRDILPRRRQWILMSGGDALICEALSPPESSRMADLLNHHLLFCGISSDVAICESYMSLYITPYPCSYK